MGGSDLLVVCEVFSISHQGSGGERLSRIPDHLMEIQILHFFRLSVLLYFFFLKWAYTLYLPKSYKAILASPWAVSILQAGNLIQGRFPRHFLRKQQKVKCSVNICSIMNKLTATCLLWYRVHEIMGRLPTKHRRSVS